MQRGGDRLLFGVQSGEELLRVGHPDILSARTDRWGVFSPKLWTASTGRMNPEAAGVVTYVGPDVCPTFGSSFMSAQFTMYSTPWCGYCQRLKGQLNRAGITFAEVNIEQHPESAEYVMSINGGNAVVPTLQFADGSALTNPSLAQVQAKLAG
jgi:mycoredoxin